MTHAFKLVILLLIMGIFGMPVFKDNLQANNTSTRPPDYRRLLEYIAIQDLQAPLVAFGEAEAQFDRQLNRENIDFLNSNKGLLADIQTRLNNDSLNWRLGTSFKQLLVVPENRREYALLFEQYCQAAIDYLLGWVQMPNPFQAVTTFQGTLLKPSSQTESGITAYLVHNIANEYIEEYHFFEEADDPQQVRIKLRNREFDGNIGAYSSRLKIGASRRFEFIRESYTLWQNSADIPFNVFIVPIEETLHVLLRPFTETAMQLQLTQAAPGTLNQVQEVIDQWMAVEEAIVGGVVQQLMPDWMNRCIGDRAEDLLAEAMAARDAHAQYIYLDKGIDVVDQLGVAAAMALYRQGPEKFRQLVVGQAPPLAQADELSSGLPIN